MMDRRFFLASSSALALSALAAPALGNIVERNFLFHFDPTEHKPAKIGLPEVSAVKFEGLTLWVKLPDPGKPVVLYFHGNAGNLASRRERFRALIDAGYGLVAMAYPGSTGSKGRQDGRYIQTMAHALYIVLPNLIGEAPVVVYGESLGTGVAVQVVARANPRPAGVVLEAPYTSIHNLADVYVPKIAKAVRRIPDPWPSEAYVSGLTPPLLVMHGGRDKVIPQSMGRAIYNAAPSTEKELFAPEKGQHENLWPIGGKARLMAFLKKRSA